MGGEKDAVDVVGMGVDDSRGSILLNNDPEEGDWVRFNPEVDGTGIGSGVEIKGGEVEGEFSFSRETEESLSTHFVKLILSATNGKSPVARNAFLQVLSFIIFRIILGR